MTKKEYIANLNSFITHFQDMIKDYDKGKIHPSFDREQAEKDIETFNAAINALEHEQALGEAFNIALLYGKEKGMEAIDNALYQMGMDGIKEQEIKALEQEPCDDAISRQAVLECFTWTNDKADIWNRIKELPPVNLQEQKTGFISKSVIEDIKAELISDYNNNADNWNYCAGIHRAIELIDNRISGKDKE